MCRLPDEASVSDVPPGGSQPFRVSGERQISSRASAECAELCDISPPSGLIEITKLILTCDSNKIGGSVTRDFAVRMGKGQCPHGVSAATSLQNASFLH